MKRTILSILMLISLLCFISAAKQIPGINYSRFDYVPQGRSNYGMRLVFANGVSVKGTLHATNGLTMDEMNAIIKRNLMRLQLNPGTVAAIPEVAEQYRDQMGGQWIAPVLETLVDAIPNPIPLKASEAFNLAIGDFDGPVSYSEYREVVDGRKRDMLIDFGVGVLDDKKDKLLEKIPESSALKNLGKVKGIPVIGSLYTLATSGLELKQKYDQTADRLKYIEEQLGLIESFYALCRQEMEVQAEKNRSSEWYIDFPFKKQNITFDMWGIKGLAGELSVTGTLRCIQKDDWGLGGMFRGRIVTQFEATNMGKLEQQFLEKSNFIFSSAVRGWKVDPIAKGADHKVKVNSPTILRRLAMGEISVYFNAGSLDKAPDVYSPCSGSLTSEMDNCEFNFNETISLKGVMTRPQMEPLITYYETTISTDRTNSVDRSYLHWVSNDPIWDRYNENVGANEGGVWKYLEGKVYLNTDTINTKRTNRWGRRR